MGDIKPTQNGLKIEIPVTQNPTEIYDAIMGTIEPELVSTQMPQLKEKYANETPEDKAARGLRYDKAFDQYNKKYADYQLALQSKSREFQMHAKRSVEVSSRQNEESTLDSIESSLSTL